MSKYLTCAEAADVLNTPERFVRRLIDERRIEFHHFGRHVRISSTVLAEYIEASRVEPITLNYGLGRNAA
ncbi:excisionase family DNA-binding protein [Actinomadura xylanilytica]|uniref:excisionase family DNA-binding protein n=1 Tax=Actinomadura xylanilytica TaxID=887459 RepID=UPI00255AE5DA|nr:excisionase family DNA-binding protein [Actinomadura xylanilytica]MDL4776352.1 excisionase family DNA-binding protein [Actinomadura xylanilytica]